jgi:hypothetical protein
VDESTQKTCYRAFARKADLQRHELCIHDKDKTPRIACKMNKCSRRGENGFLRRDHLTEHLRHFHSQDIPKRQKRQSQIEELEDDDDMEEEME